MSADHRTPASLGEAVLAQLGPEISVPTYDRNNLHGNIVHIGVGGFHRSHLASYLHDLCMAGNLDWAITGAGILPGDAAMAEALSSQDHLYTLISKGAATTTIEVIGTIVDYHLAVPDPDALLNAIADPRTQIVSLTITEGGYPVDDVTGSFIPESDLAGPESAFGLLVRGLQRRQQQDAGPITVMSCDNVMSNGTIAKAATLGEAAGIGDELVAWITESVSFPSSMVDRITPATTDEHRDWLANSHGLIDKWPVVAEPFRQWVVQDDFAGRRPPFEEVGVIVTPDVIPYELMKLRLLNAGHSCLAYLSALQDITKVDAAMSDAAIRQFVMAFLEREAAPVLPAVDGIDIPEYIDSLVERFSNPAVGDQIARLCLDGSSKLPKFVLPTLRAQLDVDGPIELTTLALASWCAYLSGPTESGNGIDHAFDPRLDVALVHAKASLDTPAAFLDFHEVFGDDLGQSERFRHAFVEALGLLRSNGVEPAIRAAIGSEQAKT